MTILAVVTGGNVISRLAGRRAAVVTREATACNHAVIETCRRPKGGGVTIVAGIDAGNVIYRLTWGRPAVMTTGAGSPHGKVVYVGNCGERIRRVAVIANAGCLDMIDW